MDPAVNDLADILAHVRTAGRGRDLFLDPEVHRLLRIGKIHRRRLGRDGLDSAIELADAICSPPCGRPEGES
jgi:hypothetical protein